MRLSLSREYVSQPCFIHRVSPPSCMNICWCEVACVKETWNYLRLSSYPHVCMSAQSLQLCPTLWTLWSIAPQAPLPKGFFRQEYWSGLPFPLPGALPEPAIELTSPALQVDSLLLSHQGIPRSHMPQLKNLHTATKIPCAITKTRCN